MDRKKALPLLTALALALIVLSACAQTTSSPAAAVALNPTPTTVPATDTQTPAPPTDTPVPPTNTPMPTDTATLTATSAATSTPTLTATSAATSTPTHTATLAATSTPTRVPPTAKPKPTAVPKLYSVTWKTGVQYEARTGTSFWCQLHDEYQNNSNEDMPFQNKDTLDGYFFLGGKLGPVDGYEPVFGIANPDGSINRWALAGWYAKRFGWRNGIEEFPPGPVKAGTASGDWTFYSNSNTGEYCRYAYIKWKGQISAAEFSGKGDLVSTNAALPAGAP